MTDPPIVVTALWSALWEARKADRLYVAPVRISRQAPKFWPASERLPFVEELAPESWMLSLPDPVFDHHYLKRLIRFGPEVIAQRLDEVAAAAEGVPIALCCFEKDRADCHRATFANWYLAIAGVEIPEYVPPAAQLSLGFEEVCG